MRLLALQTNVGLLKKQFIPEGEHEILTTIRHPLYFISAIIVETLITFALLVAIGVMTYATDDVSSLPMSLIALTIVLIVYAYMVSKSFISWKYNFLIVTSEKLIVIDHKSIIHENVEPIHLENVSSTRFESQFMGIFRCGILHIALKERTTGSSRNLTLPFIPHPDAVASAIEHAIALKQQRKSGTETAQEQGIKAEAIRETIEKQQKHSENPKTAERGL